MKRLPASPGFSADVAAIQDAISIRFNSLVYELKRKGKPVIVMSLGEAFFRLPLLPMDGLPVPEIFHYSDSRGLPELRRRICLFHRKRHGFSTDPDREMIITPGSKAAIHMTLMSILNPGDEVLYPEPAWVSYSEQIKLCRGKPVGMPMGVPLRRFESYITRKTKALILNNPHNPTGRLYTRAELRVIIELAKRRGLWLLSDEAYSEFAPEGAFSSARSVARDKSRVVVFNSLSKNFGMSGWRLGYAIGPEELMGLVLKVNQHLLTCPATILEHYAAAHFDRILALTRPQQRKLLKRRGEIAAYMKKIGLEFAAGSSTFYFFVSIAPSALGSVEFCTRLLEESQVSVVPGIGYGASCDRHVRVSIGTASAVDLRRGLDRLKSLIERTS